MATVNKEIADVVAKHNGWYPGDEQRVVKIVEYDNAWGGVGYGLVYTDANPNLYKETEYVRNPRIYWKATD